MSRAIRTTAALLAVAAAVAIIACSSETSRAAGAAPGTFQTSLPNAILLDPETNSILFEKNADQPVAPASLAKLMTLEFVFN